MWKPQLSRDHYKKKIKKKIKKNELLLYLHEFVDLNSEEKE